MIKSPGQVVGGGGGGSPGGTDGQLQYNDSGAFGGVPEGTAGQVLTSQGPGQPPAFAAAPDVIVSADVPPVITDPANDEFTEAALDTTGSRFAGAIPWAWVNQGAATPSVKNGSLMIITTSGAGEWNGVAQPTPAGTAWKFRAKCTVMAPDTDSDYSACGIFIRDSTAPGGGGLLTFVCHFLNGDVVPAVWSWTSPTVFSAGQFANVLNIGSTFYLEIERAGATAHFRMSANGAEDSFVLLGSITLAASLAPNPDQVGIGISCDPGKRMIGSCDWFRRIS